jgi:hypothetical protein
VASLVPEGSGPERAEGGKAGEGCSEGKRTVGASLAGRNGRAMIRAVMIARRRGAAGRDGRMEGAINPQACRAQQRRDP